MSSNKATLEVGVENVLSTPKLLENTVGKASKLIISMMMLG